MFLESLSRRSFLGQTASAAAALTAASWSRVWGANEKLRVASVGVGGRGWSDLTGVAASPHVQIVALCDIDETEKHLGQGATKFPAAKRYTDWRKLLEQANTFDALTIGIPDHMHAPVALPAMQLGKHVYCEKPLTHTIFEARQMARAGRKYRVCTQMGNQVQSHEAYRTAVMLVRNGAIGKVKEVHSWQSGKMGWLLVSDRPQGEDPAPPGVHWDDWLGVAPIRPFKTRIYHPFNWRAWQDFSNGQLGDFACHILDPIFLALKLTAPISVRADAAVLNREVWAGRSTVAYEFPGTLQTAGKTLKVTWYDGEGHMPPPGAHGLPAGHKLPKAGSLLVGEIGSMIVPHVAMPQVFSADKAPQVKCEKEASRNHHTTWVDSCRGVGATTSNFDYAGNLTEAVLLGAIAIRTAGATLQWNAAEMKITGSPAAQALVRKTYRKGWEPAWIS